MSLKLWSIKITQIVTKPEKCSAIVISRNRIKYYVVNFESGHFDHLEGASESALCSRFNRERSA